MRSSLTLLLLPVLLAGCSTEESNQRPMFPESPAIVGLASPVQCGQEETIVLLSDYFSEPDSIDSVAVSGGQEFNWDKGAQTVTLTGQPKGALGELSAWVDGYGYTILLKRSKRTPWKFTFDPKGETYETVQIAGSLNDWIADRNPLELVDGKWVGETYLDPGDYQYKVVVNGNYIMDPGNPDSIANGIGGYNSLLQHRGANRLDLPVLQTVSTTGDEITLSISNGPVQWYVYWENHLLGSAFLDAPDDESLIIRLPGTAAQRDRTHLRVWAANSHGISNDLLIPIDHGKVVQDVATLDRTDFHAQVLYFMMVDRFNNGNTANDQKVEDERVAERANYHGGDIAGITAKLKEGYFEDLNINTIWLSPIGRNPEGAWQEFPEPRRYYSGYHGYWPVRFTEVDKRMGTPEELKELVTEAHNRDMNLILDYVSNHVHVEHPFYQEHPDWVTQLDLPDGTKNIRIWEEQRLTTWFDTFLPSLDFSNPKVTEILTDSAMWWIEEYNLDGFRHDATKHIPEEYWRTLTQKLKKNVIGPGRKLFQIGETFGSRELIGSYVNSGQMDGQFDFNLYFDATAVFSDPAIGFDRLANSLQSTLDFYGHHHLMGNITGNHDMPRFIAFAGEDLQPNDDPKEAGWSREIVVKNPVGYERLKSLTAFTLTVPGVPVIYYGDDIGMPGANDPDNRRPMKFDNLSEAEAGVLDNAKKLTTLRRNHLSLVYGDVNLHDVTENTLSFSRQYFDDWCGVAFNKGTEPVKVELHGPEGVSVDQLQAHFGHTLTEVDGHIVVEVAPNSFEIITRANGSQP